MFNPFIIFKTARRKIIFCSVMTGIFSIILLLFIFLSLYNPSGFGGPSNILLIILIALIFIFFMIPSAFSGGVLSLTGLLKFDCYVGCAPSNFSSGLVMVFFVFIFWYILYSIFFTPIGILINYLRNKNAVKTIAVSPPN